MSPDDTDTPEVERAIEDDTGTSATRTRGGGPLWLVPVLVVILAALVLYVVLRQSPDPIHLIVLGAIVVTLIGFIIAVNPRRRSPSGGTQRR